MAKLVVGCGYLGRRVARLWLAKGHDVFAITRSASRAEEFRKEGIRPLVADVTHRESLAELPAVETVLYSVGWDRHSGVSRHEVYAGGLAAVLDAVPSGARRVIFISSTGVYGPHGSEWVDEESSCNPTREAGRAVLAAEEVLRSHRLANRAVILRLAGLYGPRRVPKMADLLSGNPLAIARRGFLNLIYADDAAAVVLAADVRATPPRVYNVSDGHPVARREFYRHLASLLGRSAPVFRNPAAEEFEFSRSGGEKRVRNTRMLTELAVRLACPTYRDGLAAIVAVS